jgi:C-lobe and N-lobe beta barrels of Tf-binding protein B
LANGIGGNFNNRLPDGVRPISYDAATDSFTLTASDLAQTLKLGQVLATAGGGQASLNFYPGFGATSYVRMAEWLNSAPAATGTGTDYRNAYFTFGMDTPQTGLVRSGTAGFGVNLRGAAADHDNVNVMTFTGTGSMLIDFATNRLTAHIPLSFTENYTGTARAPLTDTADLIIDGGGINGTDNGLGGTLHVWGGIGSYTGSLLGGFYGPSGQEIGGQIIAAETDYNRQSILTGTFAGSRQASTVDPNSNIKRLADLTGSTALGFDRIVRGAAQFPNTPVGPNRIEYDPATATYRVTFPEMRVAVNSTSDIVSQGGIAIFNAASLDAVQPLAGFNSYTASLTPTQKVHAFILPPLQLSYVSLAGFAAETIQTGFPGPYSPGTWFRSFNYFGNRSLSVPTTGTASYTGTVLGWGTVSRKLDVVTYYSDSYDVTGRALLNIDFGARSYTGTLDQLVGTRSFLNTSSDPAGATYNFPTIADTGMMVNGSEFSSITTTGYDMFRGAFFGPNAAEFALRFDKSVGVGGTDPLAYTITGVAAGKKN